MRKALFFMLLSCFLVISSQAIAEEETLTIITEDWPPYNYEENGKVKGFSTEIVQAILQELNLSYKIQVLPGARGEKLLDEGAQIMILSLFRTAEREKKYKWIGPIAEDVIYFYKRKGIRLRLRLLKMLKM